MCTVPQNIIRMIKSRKMNWVVHVARMEKLEMRAKFWFPNSKGDHLGDLGVDGRIVIYLNGSYRSGV
jgi:hypothetical protein